PVVDRGDGAAGPGGEVERGRQVVERAAEHEPAAVDVDDHGQRPACLDRPQEDHRDGGAVVGRGAEAQVGALEGAVPGDLLLPDGDGAGAEQRDVLGLHPDDGVGVRGEREGDRGVERRGRVRHPLTAPWSRAATKCRWKMRNTRSVGVRMSSDPAHSSGMSVPHCPWKAPRAPAMVRFVGSSTRTTARRNWFHVHRNMRMAREDSAGMDSGTWMRLNSWRLLAPSSRAASEMSSGMLTKCARIHMTANGMNRPRSGRMIAHRVLSSPTSRIW